MSGPNTVPGVNQRTPHNGGARGKGPPSLAGELLAAMNAPQSNVTEIAAPIASLRLASETRLRADMEAAYGERIERFTRAASRIAGFEDADTPPGERQYFLAEGVRLSAAIAPKLYEMAHRAMSHLRIDRPVEFYIYRTDVPDAFCSYDRERGIFSVCVAPEYINTLEDLELLDLLGHEIGHAMLDHVHNKFLMTEDLFYDLRDLEADLAGRVLEKHEKRELEWANEALDVLDGSFLARCRRLARLQELSADRVGLLCSRDLAASLTSHMKELTGGLSSKFINYDAAALLRQLDEIDALDRAAINVFDGTHPITAVRMKSLMLFAQSEGYARFVGHSEFAHGAAEVDQMVDDLLRQTERFPSRASDRHLIEALSAGAVHVLSPPRGGAPLAEALEAGLYRLLEYSEIPLQWIQVDRLKARDTCLSACATLAEVFTEKEREEALRMAVELAQDAGRPAARHRARAQEIGVGLRLPAATIQRVLHEMQRLPLPRRRHGTRG